MCVIIDRKPGVVIEEDKIAIACDINKHGYGFVIYEKKGIKILRNLADNDPAEVSKLLKENIDKRIILHLRHATVGEVTSDNSHPMMAMTKAEHGFDFGFMHNGTLNQFSPAQGSKLSDTYEFNEKLVKPLVKRCYALVGKGVMEDEFFQWTIEQNLKYTQSVLVFFDSKGSILRFNHAKGKQFEGWWASNDYSFDPNHFRSSSKSFTPWYDDPEYKDWENGLTGQTHSQSGSNVSWLQNNPTPKRNRKTKPPGEWDKWLNLGKKPEEKVVDPDIEDAVTALSIRHVATKLKEKWKPVEESMSNEITKLAAGYPVARTSFCQRAEIKNLSEIGRLSKTDFIELCENHAAAMAEMFIDLTAENQRLRLLNHVVDKKAANG